jgi:hypothetical protein
VTPVPCVTPTPSVIKQLNDIGGPWWLLILALMAGILTLVLTVHSRKK